MVAVGGGAVLGLHAVLPHMLSLTSALCVHSPPEHSCVCLQTVSSLRAGPGPARAARF